MITIKIDRKTVRRNPDYNPDYGYAQHVRGLTGITLKVVGGIPEYLKNKIHVCSLENPFDDDNMIHTVILKERPDDVLMDEITTDIRVGKIKNIHIECPVEEVTSLPGSPYLYEYITTMIQCLECDLVFPHVLLQSDSHQTEDGDEFFSGQICPHCGDWDCCDIEFEDLSEKELETIIKENEL